MMLCKECSSFGTIIKEIGIEKQEKAKQEIKQEKEEPEIIEIIVKDFPEKIRKAREKLGLKQKELAKKINEKLSIIHKIESGKFEPDIKLAKKIEKFLGIKLVEEYEEKGLGKKGVQENRLTIGDVIKLGKN